MLSAPDPTVRFGCFALLLMTALAGAGASAQTPAPADIAAKIQAHYSTVRDFTADFTLEQTSGLLPKASSDRGTVQVKKPGRMRWVFSTSDKNEMVADGVRVYSYFPKDKYVLMSPMPREDQASTALLFLTGRGDITRDFTPALPTSQPAGEWHLQLTPKTKQADFTQLTLQVDRQSLALRGLIVNDGQGGTQKFRFLNLRENRGIPDQAFVFTIPRGVEIRQ